MVSFFNLKDIANEIGPTRPKYIVAERISFPQILRDDVKFRDKPTVAVALTVSNIISSAGAFVHIESKIVETAITIKDVLVTATAFLVICFDKSLLNRDTSFLPRIVAMDVANKTTTVTVLIPPAVPMGEPPINISIRHVIADALVRYSCGIVANPAVLVVIDWKKAICILSKKL